MADTGWMAPTATGNCFNEWWIPFRGVACDGLWTRGVASNLADWKQTYEDFGFNLASAIAILGIEAKITGYTTNANSFGLCKLTWDACGTYTAEKEKALKLGAPPEDLIFGGPADLWGRVWAIADFDNGNFRIWIKPKLVLDETHAWLVDCLKIKVYYSIETPVEKDDYMIFKAGVSGYSIYVKQFIKNRIAGFNPRKLPDGTRW